jgi:hypothetical protein
MCFIKYLEKFQNTAFRVSWFSKKPKKINKKKKNCDLSRVRCEDSWKIEKISFTCGQNETSQCRNSKNTEMAID